MESRTKSLPPPLRLRRPGDRRSISRSATRALDVLEYLGAVRRPLRAIEVARVLGLHASTTDQLLKTMVDSSHLLFDATTKTYLPSPRLAAFGAWMVASYGADERLHSLIAETESVSGETVTLTTPNDISMQVVDFMGYDAVAAGTERGMRVSMFGSVTGTAYLSTLPGKEVKRLAHRARMDGPHLPAMLARIADAERTGAADGPSSTSDIWSLAIPLPRNGLMVPLVLGLAGPSDRFVDKLPEMRGAVIDIVARRMAARPALLT